MNYIHYSARVKRFFRGVKDAAERYFNTMIVAARQLITVPKRPRSAADRDVFSGYRDKINNALFN